MQRNQTLFALTLGMGIIGTALFAGYQATSAAAPAPKMLHKAGRAPVIVELFTSEGCSSCPSADALLIKLKKTQPIDGAEIIALGEHVDYWNNRAWADPYSAAKFSARQDTYRQALHIDSAYTPQMIVDGHTEFVGSDNDRAASAIMQAARIAKTDIQLTGSIQENSLKLQVKTAPVSSLSAGEKADVMLAITEDNLHSQVAGGENSGRRLNHAAVVRELRSVGTVNRNGEFSTELSEPLKANWKKGDLQAVIFVQAQNSRRILGAAALTTK